jgi:uncharacterized protein involved in exopolysaccharide biosynthesis
MSLMSNRPSHDSSAKGAALAQPFRQTHPAPAFRPEFMRSVRMHPVVAVLVGLLVFLFLLAVAATIKPVYLAESRVYVEPAASSPLNDPNGGAFDAVKYDSYLQQQMQTATRLDILGAAVRAVPESTWREFGQTQQQAAQYLQNALKIDRVTTSYQLSIALKGSDPEKTAEMVNAVTKAYLDAGHKDEVARTDSRRQILEEERQRIVAELAADRAEQAELSKNMGVASAATQGGNRYDAQLATLRGELIAAREAHEAAAAQLSSVASPNATAEQGLNALATDAIAGDSGLGSLKSTLNQRRASLLTQMQGLKPENPIYRQDQEELASLDRSIEIRTAQLREQAARRLQDKLRTDLARTGDLEARLNADVARETAAATSAAPKLQRAEELTFAVTRLAGRYAVVDDALRAIALETNSLPMAHLSLAAAVPTQPEASRRRLVLVAAIPLAILFGCLAAAAVHRRDPRIYIGRDMEDVLGFAPIAVLPAREDVSDRVVEEYVLRLAGGVEGAYRSDGARTFVLTPVSAATSIQSLVESLARKLEDLGLDVARTRAGDMLLDAEASHASGVLTRSRALAADGARVSLAATALDQLKTMHDLIFIDAPALLTSAEAEYVARCADATILVAECGVTLKDELYQSAALLERLQVTGVGTVLEELRLRYADGAFRNAVMLVEKRKQAATIPKKATFGRARVASAPGGIPVSDPNSHPTPEHPVDIEPIEAARPAAVRHEFVAAPQPEHERPVMASAPQPQSPSEHLAPAIYAPADLQIAPEPVSDVPQPLESPSVEHWSEQDYAAASAAQPVAPSPQPASDSGEYAREVWPARPARTERLQATKLAEQEMLSASGTAVFLKPRKIAIERLEPLGEQAALSYSADMLANSFGPLPVEFEPEPSYHVLPRGVTAEEAAAEVRAANERKAAEIRRRWQANGGSSPDPLETDEIRRLLAPAGPVNPASSQPGRDMIGARGGSIAPRFTRPEGRGLEGDSGMSEKKGWLGRLFKRETPGDLKIAPEPELVVDEPAVRSQSYAPSTYAAPPAQPQATQRMQPPPVRPAAPPAPPAPKFRPVASVMTPSFPAEESAAAPAPEPARMPPDISDMLQATARRANPVATQAAPRPAAPVPAVPAAQEEAALAAAAAIVAESAPVHTPTAPSPFLNPIVPPRRPKSFTELSQERRQGVNPVVAEPMVRESVVAQTAPPVRAYSAPAAPVAVVPPAVEPVVVPAVVEASSPGAAEAATSLRATEPALTTPLVDPKPEQTMAAAEEIAVPVEPKYPAITMPIWETAPQVRSTATRWPERPTPAAASSEPVKDADSRQRWAGQPREEALPHWPPRNEPAVTSTTDSGARIPTNLLDVQGPALSRRWGLLSRYQATEEVESDRS